MTFAPAPSFGNTKNSRKRSPLTAPNQDSPLPHGKYPLFEIDVWAHACCLKYRNVRADNLKRIRGVVPWDFISDRHPSALKARSGIRPAGAPMKSDAVILIL
jgi:superoxide dismutase